MEGCLQPPKAMLRVLISNRSQWAGVGLYMLGAGCDPDMQLPAGMEPGLCPRSHISCVRVHPWGTLYMKAASAHGCSSCGALLCPLAWLHIPWAHLGLLWVLLVLALARTRLQ